MTVFVSFLLLQCITYIFFLYYSVPYFTFNRDSNRYFTFILRSTPAYALIPHTHTYTRARPLSLNQHITLRPHIVCDALSNTINVQRYTE